MKKALFALTTSALLAACSSTPSADSVVIKLNDPFQLKQVNEISDRYQSYNVEMAEVVGGDFWRPYKTMEHDSDGNPIIPKNKDMTGYDVSQKNPALYRTLKPVDLSNPRVVALAKGLAPAYMRVSGTWANAVYFQNDGKPAGKAPNGFVNVLTSDQWQGVLNFSKAADAKIVTSFAVSNGVRNTQGVWTPREAQKIATFTQQHGGEIAAAELFNEPTMPTAGGDIDPNYNASNYAKDMKVFHAWARKALPHMVILAPGTVGEGMPGVDFAALGAGDLTSEELLSAKPKVKFDALSFHHYGAVSIRMLTKDKPMTITKAKALSPEWITLTDKALDHYKQVRDKFLPNGKLWDTETAQAAGGGDPYSSTYLDTFRYAYQLASNAKNGLFVHIHNTLLSSEYALVDGDTLEPRPNYWFAYLWAHLMGTHVYDEGITTPEGVYVFAQSSKNNPQGRTLLVINTTDHPVMLALPENAKQYTLTADSLDATTVALNGKVLSVGADNQLPELNGVDASAGDVELPAYSHTFFTMTGK